MSKRYEIIDGVQSSVAGEPIVTASKLKLTEPYTSLDDFDDDEYIPKSLIGTGGGGGGGSNIPPAIFDINAGDSMPYFIDITLFPEFDENSTFIYRIDNGDSTFTRFMDQTIKELYTGLTFNGFNFIGHDDGTGKFAEDCQIVMIAHPSTT